MSTFLLYLALFCIFALGFGAGIFIKDQFTPPEE